AGIADPATIEYLKSLGVTAVELMPIPAFAHERELVNRELVNHWGYNTLGFFAPHGPYAASGDPQGQLNEFKGMVKLLHAAGLEVILDVVYNHTCEQARDGATLSWRGLDNRAYYRLDERGHDIDMTGCGNTLDVRQPVVARMVLDSLQYWVEQCHVDGFRFDLAVTLGRGRSDSFRPNHPFLGALRTDPVISRVKLIAEPWDLGVHGWRTGQFPPPFAEWNDRFRDGIRTFWLPDAARAARHEPGHGVRELATRLSGSRDLFSARDRGPIASINFVAAHDGFTLADTTTYEHKHNRANGEGNRDGQDDNRSWNHGHEGPGARPAILTARRRTIRNLLATELIASGVPMINAGDELGRSQGGNNNAYCQDNEITWFDWDLEPWQTDLLATTRFLTRLRASNPVLGRRSFFTERRASRAPLAEPQWFSADGQPMHSRAWDDPYARTLTMLLDGTRVGGQSLLIVLHGGDQDAEVTLPRWGEDAAYGLIWDSAWELPPDSGPDQSIAVQETVDPQEDGPVTLTSGSIQVYGLLRETAP
ncbi:MAG TPA: glycogen debranching protein GlgX, partial [Dermatophilaceae bacterium]